MEVTKWPNAKTAATTTIDHFRINGEAHTFDCFECAIHALAPTCRICDTRVIGHGIEANAGGIYCCAHCAARDGVTEAVYHVRASAGG